MVDRLMSANDYLRLFCALFVVSLVLGGLGPAKANNDIPPVELAEANDKKKSEGDDEGDDEGC